MTDLHSLREGDIVRMTHTVEVSRIEGPYVEVKDKKNPGVRFGFWGNEAPSTRKIEVLRKAKPQAGDVITGAEVKATMWRRGTTIQSTENGGTPIMLDLNGDWHSAKRGDTFSMARLRDDVSFKVLHVA